MTTADMISERAARAISNSTPHSINGGILVTDVNKLLTNIKAQMLGLVKELSNNESQV